MLAELVAVAKLAAWEDVDLVPPNHQGSGVAAATRLLAVPTECLPAVFVSLGPSVDREVVKAPRQAQFRRQNRM